MNKSQVLGVLGALLLAAGVLTPVVAYPTGSMTFLQMGRTEGFVLFGCSVLSLILAVAKKPKLLWIGGLGGLGVMIYTFYRLQQAVSGSAATGGNPVADSLALSGTGGSLHFQWGWGVLLLGVILLISAGATAPDDDY